MKRDAWQTDAWCRALRSPCPTGAEDQHGKQEDEFISGRSAAGKAARFPPKQRNMRTALKGKTWDETQAFGAGR